MDPVEALTLADQKKPDQTAAPAAAGWLFNPEPEKPEFSMATWLAEQPEWTPPKETA
jgi:hypothetical protein